MKTPQQVIATGQFSPHHLSAWRSVVANGDQDRFQKRLDWTKDDETFVPTGDAGMVALAYGQTAGDVVRAFAAAVPERSERAARTPFERLFEPLLKILLEKIGTRRLRQLRPSARLQLERVALRRLTRLASPTLMAESTTQPSEQPNEAQTTEEYIDYLRGGGLASLWNRYPVLARLASQTGDLWITATAELLDRLRQDADALQEVFGGGGALGLVANISADLSDTHGGGRSVSVLTFESGVRVVYKPRPLHLEGVFDRLVEWTEAAGLPVHLRRLRSVERDGYGWLEFAAHEPCDTEEGVSRYYERCGALLCLAYVCNGTDFHGENLIASGEHPVLIDMEGLFKPRFGLEELLPTKDIAAAESRRRYAQSVLNLRMLPFWRPASGGGAIDTSSLGPPHPPAVARAAGLSQTNVLIGPTGAPTAAADHVDAITRGFEATYRLLAEGCDDLFALGGPLSGLDEMPARFILRNTNLYATLIRRSLSPDYLRDEVDRWVQFDVLARTFLALEDQPAVWPALSAEHAALDEMDVPFFLFSLGGTDLLLPSGESVSNVFSHSALDEVRDRLARLGEADLREQVDLIRASFDVAAFAGFTPARDSFGEGQPDNLGTRAEIFEAAQRVADGLLERATETGEGGLAWLTVGYHAPSRRYVIGPAPASLYAGYTGASLFLAAAGTTADEERYRDASLASLRPIRHRLSEYERALTLRKRLDVGAGTGVGSVVYALARVGNLLDEPEVIEDASRIARLLRPNRVRHDGVADVVSGAAGAVLGLLALHEVSGDPAPLRAAEEWGQWLLLSRSDYPKTGRAGWRTGGRGFECGLAHGQAGIGAALLRLDAALGGAGFRAAALDALGLERDALGAGLAGASSVEPQAAWAYGATGMGLARASSNLDSDCLADFRGVVRIIQEGGEPNSDAPDSAAQIDLLVAAADVLGDSALHDRAQQRAAALASRLLKGQLRLPWSSGGHETGFFYGSVGAGHVLLRMTDPEAVPSVYGWT